jgi:hypothetical protein
MDNLAAHAEIDRKAELVDSVLERTERWLDEQERADSTYGLLNILASMVFGVLIMFGAVVGVTLLLFSLGVS